MDRESLLDRECRIAKVRSVLCYLCLVGTGLFMLTSEQQEARLLFGFSFILALMADERCSLLKTMRSAVSAEQSCSRAG